MIVYPNDWRKDYGTLLPDKVIDVNIPRIVDLLLQVVTEVHVRHLAYSGGIDSTIMLRLMSIIHGGGNVSTYTISSRTSHPDVIFARLGSSFYRSKHHEFIVKPIDDFNLGNDAVRQLFKNVSDHTDDMITCDGIDEFMCGYYAHMDSYNLLETYKLFLDQLLPNHLLPLNINSRTIKVYIPYLNEDVIEIFRNIPLEDKVDKWNRKKVVVDIARYLEIPEEIIERNKYGFCDAFLEKDK
jgi:asparagine synthetase B (glutamine-hydrolysing)